MIHIVNQHIGFGLRDGLRSDTGGVLGAGLIGNLGHKDSHIFRRRLQHWRLIAHLGLNRGGFHDVWRGVRLGLRALLWRGLGHVCVDGGTEIGRLASLRRFRRVNIGDRLG